MKKYIRRLRCMLHAKRWAARCQHGVWTWELYCDICGEYRNPLWRH